MIFEEIWVCMAQGHEEPQEPNHHHEQQQGQGIIIMGMGCGTWQSMIILIEQEKSTIIIKSMSNSRGQRICIFMQSMANSTKQSRVSSFS